MAERAPRSALRATNPKCTRESFRAPHVFREARKTAPEAGALPFLFLKELPPELIEHGDEKGKQPATTESGKGMFAAMREMLD